MKKVLSVYLKPYYGRMLFGFVIKFIGTIMDLCLPWILAYMIDTVIPQGQRDRIYLWGLAMLVCSVLALTFNIIANRMASKVARDTTETCADSGHRRHPRDTDAGPGADIGAGLGDARHGVCHVLFFQKEHSDVPCFAAGG